VIIFVQGECSHCGAPIMGSTADPEGDTANLFLTIPGYASTIFKSELICKNAQMCAERQAKHA
jgi:hypothetical protein